MLVYYLLLSTVIPLQNATVHGVEYPPITYLSSFPLNITGSLPIYATSTNTLVEDDACSPLAQDTPDLSKYLVVIRLGTCEPVGRFLFLFCWIVILTITFTQLTKLNNVAAKGANAMLIYKWVRSFFGDMFSDDRAKQRNRILLNGKSKLYGVFYSGR